MRLPVECVYPSKRSGIFIARCRRRTPSLGKQKSPDTSCFCWLPASLFPRNLHPDCGPVLKIHRIVRTGNPAKLCFHSLQKTNTRRLWKHSAKLPCPGLSSGPKNRPYPAKHARAGLCSTPGHRAYTSACPSTRLKSSVASAVARPTTSSAGRGSSTIRPTSTTGCDRSDAPPRRAPILSQTNLLQPEMTQHGRKSTQTMSGAWKVADTTREGPASSIHDVLRCVRSLDERPVV